MKTTQKQFEIFKQECEKWIERFGLYGWRFYYQHEDCINNCLAYCIYPNDIQDRVFTIGLTVNLKCSYSLADIKRAAFHEVMEAFLHRFEFLANARFPNSDDIPEEKHNIIRVLENVLWREE